jgi:hypothetical protein
MKKSLIDAINKTKEDFEFAKRTFEDDIKNGENPFIMRSAYFMSVILLSPVEVITRYFSGKSTLGIDRLKEDYKHLL